MTSAKLLQQAVTAYKAGKREEARTLLLQYVEIDQHTELAWLLLSNLVPDLEDRIIALENALTINPDNERAAAQLWKLKRKRYQDPEERSLDYQKRLTQAIEAKEKGQGLVAYHMLRQLMLEDDRDEQVWLLLSELSPDTDSEISALENLLSLNPAHVEARARLEQLRRFRNDPLGLAKLYEDWGEKEKARDIYVGVTFESSSAVERREAERRMRATELREWAPGIKLVNPRITLIRMMLGPILLYCTFALIHGGLNPFRLSPVFWLGGLSVIIGSFFVVLATVPNTRIIWRQLWKQSGVMRPEPKKGLKTAGMLLWLLPHLLIVFDGMLRFQSYIGSFMN